MVGVGREGPVDDAGGVYDQSASVMLACGDRIGSSCGFHLAAVAPAVRGA